MDRIVAKQGRRGLLNAAGVVLLALGAAGCATDAQLRKLDQRFERGWRPSKAYCLWGGETPTLDVYCARLNFGAEGELTVLNSYVMQSLPGANAEDHAKAVLAAVHEAGDFKADLIYSTPGGPTGTYHVSVIVTDPAGKRWVLDNRKIVKEADGVSGVASFTEFSNLVRKEYWVGKLPRELDVFADLDEIDLTLR